MRKVKNIIKFVGLICLMVFTSGVAMGAEITLRFAGNMPVAHHVTTGQELLAKRIEERTGGRVKVLVYPAGQLFSDKDMMKAVPAGAVEMANTTLAGWTGMIPGLLLLDLPLFYKDHFHYFRTVDGKAGEILKEEFERVGVKLLYWMGCYPLDFASKQPIRTLEDFKGKRIRGHGEMEVEGIKALGASPTFLGGGEVYMALQRGTVDGALSAAASFWDRKYYEVVKYITNVHYTLAIYGVLMNLKKWNELPPDIQKIILECSVEAQEWGRKEAEKADRECLELLKGKGMEIYVVPEKEKERWRKAAQPTIEVFLKRAGDKGKLLLELAEKVR